MKKRLKIMMKTKREMGNQNKEIYFLKVFDFALNSHSKVHFCV